MEKRHDEQLTARIEEVANNGWALIQWWEAYLWYDQQKLGKNFWRDLKSRFDDCKPNKAAELSFISRNGALVLINNAHLDALSTKIGEE
jgi:hypothetical protein